MKTTKMIGQAAVVLALLAVASTTASAQLNNVKVQAVVDEKAKAIGLLGEFAPAAAITPATETVTLQISPSANADPTNTFSHEFLVGAFKKEFFGGYVASFENGSTKVGMLLLPVGRSKWAFTAAVEGYAPPTASVTVTLTIGTEKGSATTNAFVFGK